MRSALTTLANHVGPQDTTAEVGATTVWGGGTIYRIEWTNDNGEQVGLCELFHKENVLYFNELRVDSEGESVFRSMCREFPPLSRRYDIEHFVIGEPSDVMRDLAVAAGFEVIDIMGDPEIRNDALVIGLIEDGWGLFGPNIYYANVAEPDGAVELYGKQGWLSN